MRRCDLPKFVFSTAGILGALVIVFTFGTRCGSGETLAYRLMRAIYGHVKPVRDGLDALIGFEPAGFLQPGHFPGHGMTG